MEAVGEHAQLLDLSWHEVLEVELLTCGCMYIGPHLPSSSFKYIPILWRVFVSSAIAPDICWDDSGQDGFGRSHDRIVKYNSRVFSSRLEQKDKTTLDEANS